MSHAEHALFGRLIQKKDGFAMLWSGGMARGLKVSSWGDARVGDLVKITDGRMVVVRTGSLRDHGEAVGMMRERSRCLWLRARVLDATRDFFRKRGFLEVETPGLAAAGGMEPHIDLFDGIGGGFALVSSPEFYMKRLLTGGETRIFQIGRSYRQEPAEAMHNPEFTMLEFYRVNTDYNGIMDDLEAMVVSVCRAVGTDSLGVKGRASDPGAGWKRLTVDELLRSDGRRGITDPPDAINMVMADWDGVLGKGRPVFVKDYPASMASLARIDPDTGLAQRFELYISGVELANGFTELLDPDEQLDRFIGVIRERRAMGLGLPAIDTRFIAALAEGMPPAGGVAVGVDRLVALIANMESIEPCMTFPWDKV